jgi:RNA polymerase sigma-70 factor (ECF subfamily)
MYLERFKTDIIPLRQKLLALASQMLENRDDAEDVVQEVLLKLWTIREQLDGIANPAGFAMQTTRNLCIDRLRTRKPVVETEDSISGADEHTPYSDVERKDSVRIIKQIIESLPGLQKIIIHLRDMEGYELEEIAAITGTQLSAVTVNLSRARKKVRDRFIEINNYKGTM